MDQQPDLLPDVQIYLGPLNQLFPNRTNERLQEVVRYIQQNMPDAPFDMALDEMITVLTEDDEEGAVGFAGPSGQSSPDACYNVLSGIFPDACPDYLLKFCSENNWAEPEELIVQLSNGDYKKKVVDIHQTVEQLKEMLPNADPEFLETKARELSLKKIDELHLFIESATVANNYPTMQDYMIRKKGNEERDIYLKKFCIDTYLKLVPNPLEHFSTTADDKYKSVLISNDIDEDDISLALDVLYNRYVFLRQREIKRVFTVLKKDIFKTCDVLDRLPKHFKIPRKQVLLGETANVNLLKELSFILHKQEIKYFLKMKNDTYRHAKEEATKYNLLETCQCCFYDALIPEECYFCNNSCIFCKDCVKVGAEHVIGKGETYFPCLNNCSSQFSVETLQMVLEKKTFEPLLHKIQAEEIRKANIDGLETCPYCDYSVIPPENDKIFKCQNIDCMKETCRLCKHDSHVPLKCNDVEYDEDVKRRTYIENKMTEALIRKCYKCSKIFFKESGCNKMTCTCGASLCYVCGVAITNYDHFNNKKCPLYTEDLNRYHETRIRQFANQAKAELGVNNNPEILKKDPTEGLDNYFKTQPHVA